MNDGKNVELVLPRVLPNLTGPKALAGYFLLLKVDPCLRNNLTSKHFT